MDILRAEVKDDAVVAEVLNMQGSLGVAQKDLEMRLQSWDFDTLSLDDAALEAMTMRHGCFSCA